MAWWGAPAAPLLLAQLSLFPLPIPGAGAQVGQDFELWQSQDPVLVAAGQTITLTCTTHGETPNGPVKWLKSGSGPGDEQVVYADTGNFPRVTRAVGGSNTDFTIHIRDAQPEDAGTYYCVKYTKKLPGDVEYRRGKGTEVSVHGEVSTRGEVSMHKPALIPSMVAAAIVLCFLLLLGLLVALYMYRRKRLARLAGTGSSSPIALQCCAGTSSTPSSKVLDSETSHLPSQQSSKDNIEIHYADLQPLPTAPRHSRSPGTAASEYASIKVAAK